MLYIDEFLSVNAALKLSRKVSVVPSQKEVFECCDYLTIHVPYNAETKGFINSNHNISASEAWMTTSLFRGLEKNKVEILPLNTTSIIDINKGLQGQQHPLY